MRLLKQAWGWALLTLMLSIVAVAVASESGLESAASSASYRTTGGYVWHRIVTAINPTGVADQYASASVPNAAAYADTVYVARDLNFDGVTDSVGVSRDYVPIVRMDVYCMMSVGTGRDTLFVKALDETGGTIQSFLIARPTTLFSSWTFPMGCTRLVYFAGRLTDASTDQWLVSTYHERKN